MVEPIPDGGGEPQPLALGEALRSLREELGWSLADLRRHSGLSRPYLSRIERGEVHPSLDALEAIRQSFGPEAAPVLDELEAAGLVKRHGLDPVAAEAAVKINQLDPETRARTWHEIRQTLEEALEGTQSRSETATDAPAVSDRHVQQSGRDGA